VRILFGLTGPPGCGKDAAADHLAEAHGFARVAFADPIRQAALILDPYIPGTGRLSDVVHQYGWTTAKTRWPEVRRILQLLGTELAADPWRWEQTLQELSDLGYPVVEFPTGSVQRMTKATQLMYDAITDGLFTHDGSPQMTRHFRNCHLKEDARGSRVTK
jgi:hypothetical protein